MTLWNKVSPVFFCLDDIRSGTDDGHVRVSSARSEGSLQIFAVGVSVRRCSWLSCVVTTSTCSLDIFCVKIRFLQPSVLGVKDCDPAVLGVFPQLMFFLQLLDLAVSSEWFLQFSKPCVVMAFAGVPSPCCLSCASFKLQWTTNNRMKKMTRELFNVILFFMSFCVKLSFFITKYFL